MSRVLHRASLTLTALAVVAGGGALTASPAQAAATTTLQVRPADMLAPTDTSDGGVQEFLAHGVHLKTTNATGWARGRFHVGVPLSQVTTVDYTWHGTDKAPGAKYYVDADADGKVDGELRGDVVGGQDVWLAEDAQAFPESALADNFFATNSPCDGGTVNPGASGPCGASGATDHGTLADWAKKLQAATGKAPVLADGGYLLRGDVANGVLTQVTYGPNKYVFTDQAKADVDVEATAKRNPIRKGQKATIVGEVDRVGPAAKVTLQLKKGGKWTEVKTRKLAADGEFKLRAKPAKLGVNRFRVLVSETNSTAEAKSKTVKVRVIQKKR